MVESTRAGAPWPLRSSRSNAACRWPPRSPPTRTSRSTRSIRSSRRRCRPASGSSFVIPPAVTRGTVSITIRKPAQLIRRLDDFEREGLFERTANRCPQRVVRSASLRTGSSHRCATPAATPNSCASRCKKHQTIVVSGKTGSGKTTFHEGPGRGGDASGATDHDRGHAGADAAEPSERRAPVLQQERAGHGQGHREVAARGLPAHETRPALPGRGARRRVLLLRPPGSLGPPGQHTSCTPAAAPSPSSRCR